jgi:hypothetical protein
MLSVLQYFTSWMIFQISMRTGHQSASNKNQNSSMHQTSQQENPAEIARIDN